VICTDSFYVTTAYWWLLAKNWSRAWDVNSRDWNIDSFRRDETLIRIETILRPRRRDQDHNPASRYCTYYHRSQHNKAVPTLLSHIMDKIDERHTWLDDSVDELFPCDLPITVCVCTMKEVHDSRPVVLHPLKILHPPRVKVKTAQPLHLNKMYAAANNYSTIRMQTQLSIINGNYVQLLVFLHACPFSSSIRDIDIRQVLVASRWRRNLF